MRRAQTIGFAVFFIGSICLLVVPFLSFLFGRSSETIENKELQELPAIVEADGSFNLNVLSDLGSYFEERFPMRSSLISLDTGFNQVMFGESGMESVICGSEGWLYYHETLDDYMGIDQLDERGLAAFVYNCSYLNDYVERKGAKAIFTIAPNKNTVYPEYMPSRYLRSEEDHSAQKVTSLLEEMGVDYTDLISLYEGPASKKSGEGQPLYYKRDTHWTNYGALPAYEALMAASGKGYKQYSESDVVWGNHSEDLEDMLNPGSGMTYYAPVGLDTDAVLTSQTKTENGNTIEEFESPSFGRLVVFGDSFRDALKEPLASNYAHSAIYQYGGIYGLDAVLEDHPDLVLFERVERYMDNIIEGLVLPAEEIDSPANLDQVEADETSVSVAPFGECIRVEGALDLSGIGPHQIMRGCLGIELTYEDGQSESFKAFRYIDNDAGLFFAYLDEETYERGVVSVKAFEVDELGNVLSCSSSNL